jgi:hypothetical protein
MKRLIAAPSILVTAVFCLSSAQTSSVGVWQNVTPSDCPLQSAAGAWSGVMFVVVDPVRPSDAYFHCDSRGVWKSTDYGATWNKASTGTNSNMLATGRAWGGAIDPNPNRNPSTPPTLYVTEGYGSLGLWKSTDGGVNWADTWINNIFSTDGATNIYSDVGRDVCFVMFPDPNNSNLMLSTPHSYWGTGGNNGIFKSTDAGATWNFVKVPFAFSAHGDVLQALDAKTWIVSDGYPSVLLRTADGGLTWNKASDLGICPLRICKVGNAIYSMGGGVYKSTDTGATWKQLTGTWKTTTVIATATTLYTTNADANDGTAGFRHALLSNDNSWTNDPSPQGMRGGFDMNVTFDGKNYILLGGMWETGIWRYVEPASSTKTVSCIGASRSHLSTAAYHIVLSLSSKRLTAESPAYGLRGEKIGSGNVSNYRMIIMQK